MSEHELFASVELARGSLAALRARLEREGASPGSRTIATALHDLQVLLDKLQARYEILREILDRTDDVFFAKDRDGRYAMMNLKGANMLGKAVSDIVGADDRDLFEAAEAETIIAIDRDVMSTGEPHTREMILDVRGVPTTLLATTTAWYDGQRVVRGVIGIAQDVTERRLSERDVATLDDRMRTMAAEIVISEEQLRRSLAAELHNGLGQDIALAKMKLSLLRSSASAELFEPLSGIEQLVEQADRSLRSITYQISPPSLHDLGLVAALQWLAEDIHARYGMRVRIEDGDSPPVVEERVRVILFRAVRELLRNAALHASVREAVVRVGGEGDVVRITVEDTGAGFDTVDLDRRGYGLFGIREQLKYVDGAMHLASQQGHGTRVTLTAPAGERIVRVAT